MKKLIIVAIFLAVISPVFAQSISAEKESNMYYINVPVERVYPTGSGYIIQYRKGVGLGTVGIPNEWINELRFRDGEVNVAKAEIITLPHGTTWPTMTVFYRDGDFSHVRLYVHHSKAHPTWSNVPQSADVSKYFEPETIVLEF